MRISPQSGADINILLQEREIAQLDGRMIYLSDLNYDFNNRYNFRVAQRESKIVSGTTIRITQVH